MKKENKKRPLKKPKALVIEDSYDFFRALVVSTKEYLDLEYAPDGFTAMHKIQKEKFDLLLCDIHMPMLDGVDLLLELKKKGHRIPCLMISGNANSDIIKKALQAGAHNFLTKPFGLKELREKVEIALKLQEEKEIASCDEQEKAYIYNTLKKYYYDIERILRAIQLNHIELKIVQDELEKKESTGKCLFDDLKSLKSA